MKFFLGATLGEDIETSTVQRIFLTASTADALVTNSAPIMTVFSGSSCEALEVALEDGLTVDFIAEVVSISTEGACDFIRECSFIIIMKSALNWIYGTIGFMLFAILLMLAIKMYKRIRERK